MSKIETLRHLPTPADVRENVRQLGQMLEQTAERLDQTARQVRDLEQLPQLVADQVTEAMRALDPVIQMRQDVQRALESFDQVTAAQRETLEQLGQELATSAARRMESRAASMDKALQELAGQVLAMKTAMASMQASSQRLQALPQSLDSAARSAAETM